jgi:hypothetical protein
MKVAATTESLEIGAVPPIATFLDPDDVINTIRRSPTLAARRL